MRTGIGIFIILTIIVISLFVPEPVDNSMLRGVFHFRSQSLALLGLPIVITQSPMHERDASPSTPTPAPPAVTSNRTAEHMMLLHEQTNVGQRATAHIAHATPATPTATIPLATITFTRTAVVTSLRDSDTPTLPARSTATIPIRSETLLPALPASTPVESTATAVLLPQRILDGFRSRMPEAGYWVSQQDGIRVAVSSFQYAPQLYSSLPRSKHRFVTLTIQISNTRDHIQSAIYVDRTYVTLSDIDGKQHHADLVSDELTSGLIASNLAPQQQVTGQLAFEIGQYAAPAQIIVQFANQDTYQSRNVVVVELRVWPIIE
ncbi:MAG: DUF4352 domain-containing protein [Roseiflexaceae bacterium]